MLGAQTFNKLFQEAFGVARKEAWKDLAFRAVLKIYLRLVLKYLTIIILTKVIIELDSKPEQR